MAASPEPEENFMVPEERDLQDAICRLTSTEKDIINSVLHRDEEVRSQEKDRLRFVVGVLFVLGLRDSIKALEFQVKSRKGIGFCSKRAYVSGVFQHETVVSEITFLLLKSIQNFDVPLTNINLWVGAASKVKITS